MANGCTPDTETVRSLPTVGVVAALRELVEEMEEVLSARARGAMGGGLDEWMGGLNGRFCRRDRRERTENIMRELNVSKGLTTFVIGSHSRIKHLLKLKWSKCIHVSFL